MKIYYKDKDIAVCEKPCGISSQQADKENMISQLEKELGCTVYPVHRLDITTSGLMVYALNKRSSAMLSDIIARGELQKEYYAIVHGEIQTQGRLIDLLYHDRIKNKSFVVETERKGVKRAELKYKLVDVIEQNGDVFSLAKIKLITGRTHQIRVQLSNIGHPLCGDGKYGARDNLRIHLHSAFLSFMHPVSRKYLVFSSTPQGDLWDMFKITE
ncbi:MAG: RluA family pseudouridine synthase [Clostridia bacterium]|nr:RluA family pseudouridine synthase [Clostridia bacterium]